MAGGLIQIVAVGAQDVYLTGNPQITFFKVVYRRHTNFAMECIEQSFNGVANYGSRVSCVVSRNGDLIHRMYLEMNLTGTSLNTSISGNNVTEAGNALVKSAEVEIGGQRVDKQYGTWMTMWSELSLPFGQRTGYNILVGRGTQTTVRVPLQFWFCRNPGCALPLIALQYHEVRVNIEFNSKAGSGCATDSGLDNAKLWVDYIYLDTDERRRFAQVSHEYLIEQLQFTGSESIPANQTNNKIRMNFNHPVKEIVWVVQPDKNVDQTLTMYAGGKQHFNFTDEIDQSYYSGTPGQPLGEGMVGPNDAPNNNMGLTNKGTSTLEGTGTNNFYGTTTATGWEEYLISTGLTTSGTVSGSTLKGPFLFDRGNNPIVNAKIQLNGHDRLSEREGRYFNLVQPYQHHTNVPACGINVYSFALKPEEHQPSGTCNMSRIDQAELRFNLTDACVTGTSTIRIYAVNYNVLRIMSGMGGLAYSN